MNGARACVKCGSTDRLPCGECRPCNGVRAAKCRATSRARKKAEFEEFRARVARDAYVGDERGEARATLKGGR